MISPIVRTTRMHMCQLTNRLSSQSDACNGPLLRHQLPSTLKVCGSSRCTRVQHGKLIRATGIILHEARLVQSFDSAACRMQMKALFLAFL